MSWRRPTWAISPLGCWGSRKGGQTSGSRCMVLESRELNQIFESTHIGRSTSRAMEFDYKHWRHGLAHSLAWYTGWGFNFR